ncbi:hypothetical protein ABMA28_005326 [Loxostege sticticalis]|uniref:CCHC-type domain-containing protein n=1 Tax=Loxostege sticticalis TaxID=481309 RepID=A0ABD0SQ16_LOXSC
MTRFARAKGSKSSNEKAPEDSTPWEVMKEQLLQSKKENEESKKRQEAENQRIENYQNFLKEQKVQKKKATWCDFPETTTNHQSSGEPPKKKKKKDQKNKLPQNTTTESESNKVSEVVETGAPAQKKKKKKKNTHTENNVSETTANNEHPEANNDGQVINNSKPSKKKKNKKIKQAGQTIQSDDQTESTHQNQNDARTSNQNNNNKQQKKNKPKNAGQTESTHQNQNDNSISNQNNNNYQQKKKKAKNFVDGKPVRRKEINDRSFQLIINGKEVELVRFDGFPVMKKDADRLAELKNNMIKKGIPKSEVQRTMKLERRRAEKALARMKREVCYNCRKGGHNLSDCPELKSKIPGVDAPEGVCFKCGSTEHKQFECKVQKDKEFKFATCFICKEPGHIARQCPDNPKGLYPNGGCCKLCGDVTHLRKDCPTVKDQKEGTSIKLPTLEDNNIEDIGVQSKTSTVETIKKPKKIKF